MSSPWRWQRLAQFYSTRERGDNFCWEDGKKAGDGTCCRKWFFCAMTSHIFTNIKILSEKPVLLLIVFIYIKVSPKSNEFGSNLSKMLSMLKIWIKKYLLFAQYIKFICLQDSNSDVSVEGNDDDNNSSTMTGHGNWMLDQCPNTSLNYKDKLTVVP